jgi:hypothetical protein
MKLRETGNATLAYFYFDFRDEQKQTVRSVVTSLLVQLSAYSKLCCDNIYRLYSAHGKGMQQPSNRILIDHLKEMLAVAAQHPIFIVMDALDECPDLGMPTPREAVLNLVKELVCLHLHVPNLHIFVTSRPEVDIQTRLKPLAVNAISLQDESRQKAVISNYVSSVVSSDEQMKQWRDEDKRLVVHELAERADGMSVYLPILDDEFHIIPRAGFNGCSVNSRLCGTQSSQMYDGFLRSCQRHWTKRMSGC